MILENYYRGLETITSIDTWELLKQLKPIEGKLEDGEEDKIKTERKVLSLSINNGNLFPKTSRVDISGQTHSYPDIKNFTEIEIEYLKSRIKAVNNSYIKCRYSHILWEITKNNQYAELSINLYLSNIEDLFSNKDNKRFNEVNTFVDCLLFIGAKTKIDTQTIKTKVFDLLKSKRLPNYIKSHILESGLNSNLLKPKELEFALNDVLTWIDIEGASSFFQNQSILDLAIVLSEKLQKPTNKYYELLAQNQDLIIKQHPDEKDFVRYISYGEKAKYYRKAGDLKRYDETLEEYTRLKNKFELGRVEFQLPEKETQLLNDYLNQKSEIILKIPIEGILMYFASDDDLLIKEESLDKMTEEGLKNSIRQIFSTSTFDINTNYKKESKDGTKANERFRNYSVFFNISILPLILKVFANGIINGKINYNSTYKFLQTYSWFGQKFPMKNNERDIDEESTWLSLFAPGLNDYFSQLEWAVIMAHENIQNFILCIDSLTLKFEGAIRDYIRLLGGTTTTEKRGELKEQLLEELLMNKVILESFTTEDISLFKYVFTNKGWNLRNNVAHCFYPYSSYTFEKATLILLCILRLGKYKLVQKKINH